VRLKGVGKLKESNDLIGNSTSDFPACSKVPQPTTLLYAPMETVVAYYIQLHHLGRVWI
jgi:hypothetical protein